MNTLLHINALQLTAGSSPINETLPEKTVIALAGLDGHGQESFLEALAGIYKPFKGTVSTKERKTIRSLNEAYTYGARYLPANRKKNGIFPGLSVLDNFRLGRLDKFSKFGIVNHVQSKKSFKKFTQDLSIKFSSISAPITALSGGNQQKVLLAGCLVGTPEIILLNDPTRGVDMQTRRIIYNYLKKLKNESNVLIVVLSTELEEIMDFCDEVFIFREFNLFKKIKKEEITMDKLLSGMFGENR